MFVQRFDDLDEFLAGDHTRLREFLHPDKHPVDLRYSLAHATVPVGATTLKHRLETSEVYYILHGTGRMTIDDETAEVKPGDCIYIPPRALQYITNTAEVPLAFICIVDPAWRAEDEEILD